MSESPASKPALLTRIGLRIMTGKLTRFIGGGSSTLQATSHFLRRQKWAWPLVAALILGGVGWWVNSSVENAMSKQRVDALTTILEADVAALQAWMSHQRHMVELIGRDEQLLPEARELLALRPDESLLKAKAQQSLRTRLKKPIQEGGFVGYLVVSPAGVVVAADQDVAVGNQLQGYRLEFCERVLRSKQSAVSLPFRNPLLLPDENGELRANFQSMFAAVPLLDDKGKPLAILGLRIRPEAEFTRILQTARMDESGETYAFDRHGLLLSQSRFDDELKEIGILADLPLYILRRAFWSLMVLLGLSAVTIFFAMLYMARQQREIQQAALTAKKLGQYTLEERIGSPEAINEPDHVDARTDVYAIGAVGYFPLTGSPVFAGGTMMEICMKHVQAVPEPPSKRLGKPITPVLEELLLRCFAKSRLERAVRRGDMLRALEAIQGTDRWTAAAAASWWATDRDTGASEELMTVAFDRGRG